MVKKKKNERKIILNRTLSGHDSEIFKLRMMHALEKWKQKEEEVCKQLL